MVNEQAQNLALALVAEFRRTLSRGDNGGEYGAGVLAVVVEAWELAYGVDTDTAEAAVTDLASEMMA